MSQARPDPSASPEAAPIRLGLVGLGMAGGVMAAAADTHPAFALAGAADLDEVLRSRFEADHPVATHADVADLVRRADVDAVYVATPHQFHREHAVLAAEHGKHVVVEKPMALSLVDCDAMIEAAERNGVALIVGHTHGFDPSLQVMRELIAGDLGRPAMIAAWNYTDFLYRPRRPEELDTSLGGGSCSTSSPTRSTWCEPSSTHRVRSVRAVTAQLDPERPTEGACTVLLEFEDGAAASLVYSGYDGFDSDELHGWVSEGGYPKQPGHGGARHALLGLCRASSRCAARVTAMAPD